jgi:hypothetical protein
MLLLTEENEFPVIDKMTCHIVKSRNVEALVRALIDARVEYHIRPLVTMSWLLSMRTSDVNRVPMIFRKLLLYPD